ncbi:hypothetical protein [Streptomyces canus]|uniref:hypothetical protein n=1 Tax=Streptomyces canus TaxID=58343 RepID=UPI00324F5959
MTGPDDQLSAVTNGAGTSLQLVDLHGDVMATEISGTGDTGPTATYTYTEFGAPDGAAPGTYGWLGGYQRSGSSLGGTVLMGLRVYDMYTGRFLQVDSVLGGSANAYDYADQCRMAEWPGRPET